MIILHYHLFKNAGTSLDAMFRENFGDRWVGQEFEANGGRNVEAVRDFLIAHPGIAVLSSHTAIFPVPEIEGVDILPVLFVRHPLLRARSAYSFERKQAEFVEERKRTRGAQIAIAHDFPGYVRELLSNPNSPQIRNFQAHRLAPAVPDAELTQRERALRAAEALPFVGLVERYDESVDRLARVLAPAFPDFRRVIARRNVGTADGGTLNARLAQIREELGDSLYAALAEANSEDLALFEKVAQSYSPIDPDAPL